MLTYRSEVIDQNQEVSIDYSHPLATYVTYASIKENGYVDVISGNSGIVDLPELRPLTESAIYVLEAYSGMLQVGGGSKSQIILEWSGTSPGDKFLIKFQEHYGSSYGVLVQGKSNYKAFSHYCRTNKENNLICTVWNASELTFSIYVDKVLVATLPVQSYVYDFSHYRVRDLSLVNLNGSFVNTLYALTKEGEFSASEVASIVDDPYQVFQTQESVITEHVLRIDEDTVQRNRVAIPTFTRNAGEYAKISFECRWVSGNMRLFGAGDLTSRLYISENRSSVIMTDSVGDVATQTHGDLNTTRGEWEVFEITFNVDNTVSVVINGTERITSTANGAYLISFICACSDYAYGISEWRWFRFESATDNRFYSFNLPPATSVVPDLVSGQDGTLENFKERGEIVDGEARLRKYTLLETARGDGARSTLLETGMTKFSVYFEALRLNSIEDKTLIIGCSYPGFYIQQRNAAGGITIGVGTGDKHAFFNFPVDGNFHSFLATFDTIAKTVVFKVDDVEVYQLTDVDMFYANNAVDGTGANDFVRINGWMHLPNSTGGSRDIKGIVRVWDETNNTGLEWDFNNAFDDFVPESTGKHGLQLKQVANSGFIPLEETLYYTYGSGVTRDFATLSAFNAQLQANVKTELLIYEPLAETGTFIFGNTDRDIVMTAHQSVRDTAVFNDVHIRAGNGHKLTYNHIKAVNFTTGDYGNVLSIDINHCDFSTTVSTNKLISNGDAVTTIRNSVIGGYRSGMSATSEDLLLTAYDTIFYNLGGYGTTEGISVGATLYNCIGFQKDDYTYSHRPIFSDSINGAGNITKDSNIGLSGQSTQLADIESAFADPANGDYRIKQSYADSNLATQGWNGSSIASWAYYSDDIQPPTGETSYSLSLGGAELNLTAERNTLASERVVQLANIGEITGESLLLLANTEYALSQSPFGVGYTFDDKSVQLDRAVDLNSFDATTATQRLSIAKEWESVLRSMTERAESVRARITQQRGSTFFGALSNHEATPSYAQKDWSSTLHGVEAQSQLARNEVIAGYNLVAKPASVTIDGVTMTMSLTILGEYAIVLLGMRSNAEATLTHLTTNRLGTLSAFNTSFFGATMYVNKDIQANLSTLGGDISQTELHGHTERVGVLGASVASVVVEDVLMTADRNGSFSTIYAQSDMYGLTMTSTAVVKLSKTNIMSGYTVSFESSPVSVIYDYI